MNYTGSKLLFLTLSLSTAANCSNTAHKVSDVAKSSTSITEEEDGRIVTNAAAKEVKAHNFVEIKFPPLSAVLSQDAIAALESVVTQAKKSGTIDQFIVLSWSDQEYPSKAQKNLSRDQIALAEQRNLAIKKHLSLRENADVDLYNMSERPNMMSKFFNTTDAKLKKSLMAAGLPTTADDPQYPSKASHSVVLVKVD